jgi:hypothetical protein
LIILVFKSAPLCLETVTKVAVNRTGTHTIVVVKSKETTDAKHKLEQGEDQQHARVDGGR